MKIETKEKITFTEKEIQSFRDVDDILYKIFEESVFGGDLKSLASDMLVSLAELFSNYT